MIIDIIHQLTQKELRIRYKHLSLGYVWSIANPLSYAFLYFIIFKTVMKVRIEDFPIFLICGLFPWQWFANTVGIAPMTFLGNAPLIKKVNFPRNLLSFVSVLQDLIHFFVSIPVILVFLFVFNRTPTLWWLLGIPLLALIQFLLTYGLNLLIATLNLFFRDLERLVQISMTFLFYSTPVVYDIQMIPSNFQKFIVLNPIAPLIICWRDLFLNGFINWYYLSFAAGWSLLVAVSAQFIYKKLSWRFAEIL